MGIVAGLFYAGLACLSNLHDGYTDADFLRDVVLGVFIFAPIGGVLGWVTGTGSAFTLKFVRASRPMAASLLLLMVVVVGTVLLVTVVAVTCLGLFYPLY